MTQTADVTVENHGTIFLFHPQTTVAREWIDENVDPDPTNMFGFWRGSALCVEHRFAQEIAQDMINAGLAVE